MQPFALRALEFDRIREALALEALTALGRDRAEQLEPATEPAAVLERLNLVSEAAAFTRGGGSLAISAPEDLADILEILHIGDQPLEPLALLGLSRFVESVGNAAAGVVLHGGTGLASHERDQSPHSTRPLLSAIAGRVTPFDEELRAVRRAIHPSGDVNDDASPALREVRDKLRRQRGKLRTMLDGLTRGRDTAKYLQDQIVTDRNGRYVVVLRAEHREAIPGIVHGASASGASLYLEPMSTVELNNEVAALSERERQEIHRILLALTDLFRRRGAEFGALVDVAADFDELYAKVQLARRVDGIAPGIADDGRVEFRGARHPLLIPSVRDLLARLAPEGTDAGATKGPAQVIATDLLIVPPTRALVISGPNTGGKTVALKATGLLALMAQAGLLIPVDAGSRFTPFRCVFADIGDEQSISASLSTFSAHVANLVAMDRSITLPALILLDEVGGGTDPVEGGALGTAVIDHFRQRGATVIATTHDDALKSYAATTEGVTTAAFGFNPETYAPTYKLIYGAPGRSLALEIAERLGMPASVISAARARRSNRESQLAEHLARIDRELASLDAERGRVEEDRRAVAAERQALLARESKLTEREAVLRKRLDDKLNDRLRDAREEVDKIVADLKGKAGSLAQRRGAPQLSTGEIGGLRAEARAALEAVGDRLGDSESGDGSAPEPLAGPLAVGQDVFVAAFGARGIVRGFSGAQVDVEVKGKRMRVPLSGLKRAAAAQTAAPGPRTGAPQGRAQAADVFASRELMLIGSTVDDAMARVEKFLDDALLGDERRLRIVHGHGTGRLRDAVRKFFHGHPLVASTAPAADNEGGDGATIVELKE